MIINLTKSVPLKELCKITTIGHMPDTWLFFTNYDEVIEFHHDGKITLGHSNSILGD